MNLIIFTVIIDRNLHFDCSKLLLQIGAYLEFKTISHSQYHLTRGYGFMQKTSCLSYYLRFSTLEGTGYEIGVE